MKPKSPKNFYRNETTEIKNAPKVQPETPMLYNKTDFHPLELQTSSFSVKFGPLKLLKDLMLMPQPKPKFSLLNGIQPCKYEYVD